MTRIGSTAVAGVFALLVLASVAHGATFVVNNPTDLHDLIPGNGLCDTVTPNVCTLRAAIEEANQTSAAIVQVPAGTFTLTLGALLVNKAMTIAGTGAGAGAGATIVSGNNLSGVFAVGGTGLFTATIQRMTIRDGNAASIPGGGIYSYASEGFLLVVDSCLITHCYARLGGGIASNGLLTVTNTTISDCHATHATLSADGGALALVENATVSGCTLSGNSAKHAGGAVYQYGGVLDIVNSTVNGNVAGTTGGGIYVEEPSAVGLYNVTVTDNLAITNGGGVTNTTGIVASLTLQHSIVSGNSREQGDFIVDDDCAGSLLSTGANIVVTVDASHCTVSGVYSSQYPFPGALGNNGGPTQTRALLASSPAIDAGNALGCTTRLGAVLTKDQRGVSRPIGAKCDLGAYERSPCGDANGDGLVNVSDVLVLINFLFAGGAIPPGLANVNQDESVTVSDVLFLINNIFAGGPAPSCPGT